jgi:prepilin-type N-terminal cleavage/methylation domain-containing protein
MRTENRAAPGGFTIIELLTVIAVIVIIIAMIVPGINYAKKIAKELRVRTQVKTLGEAVEAFYGANDFYPPSDTTFAGAAPNNKTCGAQKFAAALVGIDMHGYDPQGDFDLMTTQGNPKAYAIAGVLGATQADEDKSIGRRKDLYVTPSQDMVACDMKYLYDSAVNTKLYAGGDVANKKMGPVLCDGMKVKEITVPTTNPVGTATLNPGTPFLYFKANADSKILDKTKTTGNIYNYADNADLLALTPLSGEKIKPSDDSHHGWYTGHAQGDGNASGPKNFYDSITNPAITTEARPYNMGGYLIISAGTDGLYGTKDDITNFKK